MGTIVETIHAALGKYDVLDMGETFRLAYTSYKANASRLINTTFDSVDDARDMVEFMEYAD